MAHFKIVKHKFPNYAARSSVRLSNHTRSEAMHNVSTHQMPQYYQQRQLPFTAVTASVTWYMHHKLARAKILKKLLDYLNSYATVLPHAGCDKRSSFKRSKALLISLSYIGCLTIAKNPSKEPSLPYKLPIAGGRIDGFMFFQRVLARTEMQTALFSIWTHIIVSISYDDNRFATSASNLAYIAILYLSIGLVSHPALGKGTG